MPSLKFGDLKDCVIPKISIDEYEPKISDSNSVIVIAFNVLDKDVADDLDNYLDKSWIEILDVDTSPHPLPDGTMMVFVEVKRDEQFVEKFRDIVKEVENLTGKIEWKVKVRGEDKEFEFDPDVVVKKVNVDEYVPMQESKLEKAKKYMQDSGFIVETEDKKLKLSLGSQRFYFNVIHMGDINTISESIKKIPVSMDKDRYETIALKRILGEEWDVLQMKEHISLQRINTDDILVVRL